MADILCEVQDCYWKSIDPEPVDRLVKKDKPDSMQVELIERCKSRCSDHALRLIANDTMKLDQSYTVSRVRRHLKDVIQLRGQQNA